MSTTAMTGNSIFRDFYDIGLRKFKSAIDYDDSVETPLAMATNRQEEGLEGRLPPRMVGGLELNPRNLAIGALAVGVVAYLLLR